ncbi:MAG: PepSY domain-containing protein [Rhodospirillaceae bacterium]|nr:PepSY domain-containing protein [Rhodospirillaceae bacterium]
MLPRLKRVLFLSHRWLSLVLTPIFLVVVLSGGVLAIKPMLPIEPPAAATAQAVAQILSIIDPDGQASSVGSAMRGHALRVVIPHSSASGVYSILTGERVGDLPFDVFAFAKSVHVRLLADAKFLVKVATYVMTGLIVVAPFLMRPRLRATPQGVHILMGWVGFPVLLLTPLTAVLMTLHVGRAALPVPRQAQAIPLTVALEHIAATHMTDAFVSIRRFKGGTALAVVQDANGPSSYVVGAETVVPMRGGKGLVSELHEGTWAGAWSGALNLIAALGLFAMIVTGWWSWLRKRLRKPQQKPKRLLSPPGVTSQSQ